MAAGRPSLDGRLAAFGRLTDSLGVLLSQNYNRGWVRTGAGIFDKNVFARISPGFRFENIFVMVRAGREKRFENIFVMVRAGREKSNQFLRAAGAPAAPRAPPSRGPRGHRKN